MSDCLKNLYCDLETADLDLLLNIQNGALHRLPHCLRVRRRRMDRLGEELRRRAAAGEGARTAAECAEWQRAAIERDKRIVSQARSLYTAAKGELLKFRNERPGASPYARTAPSVNRIKA